MARSARAWCPGGRAGTKAGLRLVEAASIATRPPLAVKAAKESILAAFNTGLNEGLAIERGHFWMLLASEDANEGMNAFVEKRKPVFKGK